MLSMQTRFSFQREHHDAVVLAIQHPSATLEGEPT
jgi:hypothetical protein